MSLAVSISLVYARDSRLVTFILRDADANASPSNELIFEGGNLIHENNRINVYRGKVLVRSSPDSPSVDAVCKIAYGRRALEGLDNEARLYLGKLKHLQDVFIPKSYGYFIGDTDEGPTGCLVLEYCGEPVVQMLKFVDPAFRDAVVSAVEAIHDAGVRHRDISEDNILDHNGRPMIINFEAAQDHVCERKKPIVKGAIEPHPHEFNCDELQWVCRSSLFWKTRYIMFDTLYYDVSLASDARKLAEKAPPSWTPERALDEAYRAIVDHVKAWYPERYATWLAETKARKVSLTASNETPLAVSSCDQSEDHP
ncbi:hypothetical protein EWM64_g3613 [Hericium alpestre]|uniref:Protein kinase domain-containing protein n=1 Tax=Hericium alpestre TaxID=135208 RepID=A0A4Y9ZZZ7_9AGAM|nr:hypothetical protein EWM64_g3613 [Hericium alpestre]